VKDGEVWNAAGIMSWIGLAASFARVCFDKDVGWGGEELEGDLPKPDKYT